MKDFLEYENSVDPLQTCPLHVCCNVLAMLVSLEASITDVHSPHSKYFQKWRAQNLFVLSCNRMNHYGGVLVVDQKINLNVTVCVLTCNLIMCLMYQWYLDVILHIIVITAIVASKM